jgi:hypothetical protein
MGLRKMKLADHRGRDAIVVLVPRQVQRKVTPRDTDGRPIRFTRLVKATERTHWKAIRSRFADKDDIAQALIHGDPEINLEATGRETGPCDRVFVDGDSAPLYSAAMVEVVCDAEGRELERRDVQETPANLQPDTAAPWSGKLIPTTQAARRYAFTRAYQVRHTNGLEFDFLLGLASYLENKNALALVGSGSEGRGPLILERNGTPLKGFLEGRTQGETYLLVLHLASFELKGMEVGS